MTSSDVPNYYYSGIYLVFFFLTCTYLSIMDDYKLCGP